MTSISSGLTPKWVTGDARWVALVLGHLLDNAMAHASAGRIEVAGDTHVAGAGYMSMTFSVRHTGCGMDNHHQLRILSSLERDMFFKDAEGPPVCPGLALSSRIANAMGGPLWFDSKEGDGSTFGFSNRCSSDPVKEAGLTPATRSGGLRVLVMEEHPATRFTCAGCLSRAGMEPRTSRLLMLTSSPSAKDMFECESLGVHGYHAKGTSGDSLIAAVLACVDPHLDRILSVSAQS